MSSEEVTEWMAYDRLEPIGHTRREWELARLVSAVWSAALATAMTKKRPKLPPPSEFLEQWDLVSKVLKKLESEDVEEGVASSTIQTITSSIGKGVSVFEGDAPTVKRIGKRATKPNSKRRARIDKLLREMEPID